MAVLENSCGKEEDLLATGIGIVQIAGGDRPPCRSTMFRTGRDAGAYRNSEEKCQWYESEYELIDSGSNELETSLW